MMLESVRPILKKKSNSKFSWPVKGVLCEALVLSLPAAEWVQNSKFVKQNPGAQVWPAQEGRAGVPLPSLVLQGGSRPGGTQPSPPN